MELTAIQQEIQKALCAIGDRPRFSEAILAKKIRETAKIEGKKKAGIGLADLEKAVEFLENSSKVHYSLILNSANDLLIERTEDEKRLDSDARQRRLKSEKSMSIFTNSDLNQKNKSKSNIKKRTERKSLNIYSDFEET